MAHPQVGRPFPDFELGNFSTRSARSKGPLLLVVWRTDCPTCRLALPFFERIHRAYPSAVVAGVVQNSLGDTEQYCAANHITMPAMPDAGLTITRRLGVDTVPAYWLIDKGGEVLMSGMGWDRTAIEQLAQTIAARTGAFYAPVVKDEDNVPAIKPG